MFVREYVGFRKSGRSFAGLVSILKVKLVVCLRQYYQAIKSCRCRRNNLLSHLWQGRPNDIHRAEQLL